MDPFFDNHINKPKVNKTSSLAPRDAIPKRYTESLNSISLNTFLKTVNYTIIQSTLTVSVANPTIGSTDDYYIAGYYDVESNSTYFGNS